MPSGKHHIPTTLLASILISGNLIHVQAREQGSNDDDSAVEMRVLCSQPVEGASELKLVQNGAVKHDLSLTPAMVGDSIKVGRGELLLARQGADAGEPDPVLRVAIPACGRRFVLALFPSPDPDPDLPYQHVLIRIDGLKFGPSELYLYNLTGGSIEGSLGTKDFSLEPGASEVVIPAPGSAGERTYQARFYHVVDEQKNLFNDATWPLAGSSRVYLFFVPDALRESVSFVSFREYAPFD